VGSAGRRKGLAVVRERGFSLVEIAITLVVIGLLLGGILKGQEMINSAKVRNLADLSSGVSAAYFGFIDRFRRVPGDWDARQAAQAIGVAISGGGNDNGRIDNDPTSQPFAEPNALWEHVAKAGFIEGAYTGDRGVPTTTSNQTPLNAFNNIVVMGRTADYISANFASTRLTLVLGRGVPVDIAQELDIKLDDGMPGTGVMRLALDISAGAVFGEIGESDAGCHAGGAYDVSTDVQDCNPVYLY